MRIWLPAYCTELNPIERFWRHLKDQTCANQLWSSQEEIIEKVEQVLSCFLKTYDYLLRQLVVKMCDANDC